ncbi:MAG: hypothetical protein ACUVS4_05005 [Chloroflexaceae bacterium]
MHYRLSDGKGNSIAMRGLAAAADGALLIVGDAACCLQNQSVKQLFNQTPGNDEADKAFLLLVNPAVGVWGKRVSPHLPGGRVWAGAVFPRRVYFYLVGVRRSRIRVWGWSQHRASGKGAAPLRLSKKSTANMQR